MADQVRRVLSVFLASPNDVVDERLLAREAVDFVNRLAGPQLGWYVELVVWEDTPPAFKRPQTVINKGVDTCDLFVGILWERWGQPTGEYSSGFEEEFQRARRRHVETGSPEIWLFFCRVDPKKIADPGDQLKLVLAFKREQIERRELLFKEYESPEEWRLKFIESLLKYLFEQTPVPRVLEVAAEEPVAAARGAGVIEPLSEASPSVSGSSPQLRETLDQLSDLVARPEFHSSARSLTSLNDFHVARLNLLAISLMTQIDGRVLLDVMTANRLYSYYKDVQPTPAERNLILRTLVADRNDLVPGWFWLRTMQPGVIERLLFHYAETDSSVSVRSRALLLLGKLGVHPQGDAAQQKKFFAKLARHEDATIRLSALDYYAAIGTLDDLEIVEQGLNDRAAAVRDAAARARFRILLRHDVGRSLELFASGDRAADGTQLQPHAARLRDKELQDALTSENAQARRFAAEELKRRGELTEDRARALTRDPSPLVRAVGFEDLIDRGVPVTPEEIDNAFKAAGAPTLLGGLSGDRVDIDGLLFKIYATYSPERLEKELHPLALHGVIAYRVLALRHFDKVSVRLRRDLGDELTAFDEEGERRIREELGEIGVRMWRQATERTPNLREFTRQMFLTVALEGLVEKGTADDVGFARKHITASHYYLQLQAVRLIHRFGEATDLDVLLPLATGSYGEVRRIATEAALKLSPGLAGAAATLFESDDPYLVGLALKVVADVPPAEAEGIVDGLLESEKEAVRVKAVAYLLRKLSVHEVERFLGDYLEPPYYYNVACWLDRLLFAPAPLVELFREELTNRAAQG